MSDFFEGPTENTIVDEPQTETDVSDAVEDTPPTRAHRGQIDGAPEDGESLYEVVDEQTES